MVSVAIVGAGGGIGQPLSLLMKLNRNVTNLALIDVSPIVAGVAADLSHIPTPARVTHLASANPREALKGADLVLIPAGIPRKPGMTRDDLFAINAGIVKGVAEACADACPDAFVGVISNPVNSTVPIFVEAFKKKHGSVNVKKIFGVTTLDILRAETFAAEIAGVNPAELCIPVVGGHAGTTIVPLFSRAKPAITIPEDRLEALVSRTQNGGTEVVEAKGGAGSATLSMAQAALVFADKIITAIKGGTVELCAYVGENPAVEGVSYFASPLKVGKEGIVEYIPIGAVSEAEKRAIDAAIPELKASAEKGIAFANQ